MLAFLGAWTIMELVFFVPLLIAISWATHLDRNGRNSPKWAILVMAFIIYWIYYVIKSPPQDWFPPVFHKDFWADRATWLSISKYLVAGVCYALFEMLSGIIEEKGTIRARWNLELETNAELKGFVTGATGDTGGGHLNAHVSRFCRSWNSRDHIVRLQAHILDRTPQPSINFELIKDSVFPWILLWPGYLVSMFFGRILDRIVAAINSAFRAIGNAVVRALFHKTFSAN